MKNVCFVAEGLFLCDQETEACLLCANGSRAMKTPRVESRDELVEHAASVMASVVDLSKINTALGNLKKHTRLAKAKKKVLGDILYEIAIALEQLYCSGTMLYFNLRANQLQDAATEVVELP